MSKSEKKPNLISDRQWTEKIEHRHEGVEEILRKLKINKSR